MRAGAQGIAISYINSMGEISDPEDGKALQNFMICVEMALAGLSLLYAFPHKEFNMGGSTGGWRLDAFLHAISIKDVVVDTIHVVSTPSSWQDDTCGMQLCCDALHTYVAASGICRGRLSFVCALRCLSRNRWDQPFPLCVLL
jgi:hypothetical protein